MVSLEYQPDQVMAVGIDNTIGDGRVEGCEVVIMRLNGIAWRASFVVSLRNQRSRSEPSSLPLKWSGGGG